VAEASIFFCTAAPQPIYSEKQCFGIKKELVEGELRVT